jgi:Transposase IS116/IS110/IS902 family
MLTRDVARVKSRLKSFFRARGLPCSGEALFKPAERAKRAEALPLATREAVELVGRELEQLVALEAEAEASMLRESHRHRISRLLESAPGFGPVRVALLLPIVITPHRFRTKRQFWAYCGFAVVTRSSSDWVQEQGRWMKTRVAADTRAELQPQPHAESDLQGRGDDGHRALRAEPAAPGLRPAARKRHAAEPGQAHGGTPDRRHRAGHVEETGGIRPRKR